MMVASRKHTPWASLTNVGVNIPDAVRGACEASDRSKAGFQEAIRQAKRNKGRDLKLTGESADSPIYGTKEELTTQTWGELVGARGARYLMPIAIVADPSWPTRNGIRKEYNRKQWEIIVEGRACFRCGYELPIPFADCPVPGDESGRPGCGWSQRQTSKAFDALYERKFIEWQTSQQARAVVKGVG